MCFRVRAGSSSSLKNGAGRTIASDVARIHVGPPFRQSSRNTSHSRGHFSRTLGGTITTTGRLAVGRLDDGDCDGERHVRLPHPDLVGEDHARAGGPNAGGSPQPFAPGALASSGADPLGLHGDALRRGSSSQPRLRKRIAGRTYSALDPRSSSLLASFLTSARTARASSWTISSGTIRAVDVQSTRASVNASSASRKLVSPRIARSEASSSSTKRSGEPERPERTAQPPHEGVVVRRRSFEAPL